MLMAWLGAVSYTLQIYFDFSGYSDMAIGLGLMFGFHFNENFNYPYVSKSITEFWRRWHISLGSWFRDYVYFPLGGSRVEKKSRLIFNLFVVWTLTGIWHGASWNFVFWGLFYFALLTFEKLTGIPKKLAEKGGLFPQIYRIFTLFCVMLGWVFFRSEGLKNGVKYVAAMFIPKSHGEELAALGDAGYILSQNWFFIIAGIVLSTPFVKYFNEKITANRTQSAVAVFTMAERAVLIGLFFIALSFTVSNTYNPFIYFNF